MNKYIVAAIIILALATLFFFQKSDIRKIQQKMPIWMPIEAPDVVTIKIKVMTEGETIVLHQSAGEWQLADDSMADNEAVERLLKDLGEMRPVRVVTRKRNHDDKLQLGDHSIHLLLLDAGGREVFNATVGKQGADLLSTYLRLDGTDAVLAVNKSLNWQLRRSADNWRKEQVKTNP